MVNLEGLRNSADIKVSI